MKFLQGHDLFTPEKRRQPVDVETMSRLLADKSIRTHGM